MIVMMIITIIIIITLNMPWFVSTEYLKHPIPKKHGLFWVLYITVSTLLKSDNE